MLVCSNIHSLNLFEMTLVKGQVTAGKGRSDSLERQANPPGIWDQLTIRVKQSFKIWPSWNPTWPHRGATLSFPIPCLFFLIPIMNIKIIAKIQHVTSLYAFFLK